MALALMPLVVTLTFGPSVERIQDQEVHIVCFPERKPSVVDPQALPAIRSSSRQVFGMPRWPGDLYVNIETSNWITVFTGYKLPHEVRAEVRDLETQRSEVLGSEVNDFGWAGFQPSRRFVTGHHYVVSFSLVDSAGHRSMGRPTIGFAMPDLESNPPQLVFNTAGDPELPVLWQPSFLEKLLFFVLDPFVLAYMATNALIRRRRRQRLLDFLAS